MWGVGIKPWIALLSWRRSQGDLTHWLRSSRAEGPEKPAANCWGDLPSRRPRPQGSPPFLHSGRERGQGGFPLQSRLVWGERLITQDSDPTFPWQHAVQVLETPPNHHAHSHSQLRDVMLLAWHDGRILMFSNRCSKNSFQIKAIARAKILLFPFFWGGWGVGWGEGAPPDIPGYHPLPQA